MSETIESQVLRLDVDVECPRCGYPFWVRMSEVVVQLVVLCPCCHCRVHLVDDRGSAATAGAALACEVDSLLSDLF